jgi:hypothetical protein
MTSTMSKNSDGITNYTVIAMLEYHSQPFGSICEDAGIEKWKPILVTCLPTDNRASRFVMARVDPVSLFEGRRRLWVSVVQ